MVPKICSIADCKKLVHARGWCVAHYRRNRLNGDPLLSRRPGLGITPAQRLDLYTDKSGDCWMWTGSGDRYGKTCVSGRYVSAHILSYELNVGPVPSGQIVRHRCDTPKCVRPEHLELGTNADNSRDMTDRQRQARGERQWCAKMTAETVIELREAYSLGKANIPELSRQYGISTSTVGKIINNQTWKHVPTRKVS